MKTPRRARPEVGSFESRVLMSAAIPGPSTLAAEVSTKIYPPPLLLRGSLQGRATVRAGGPDVGEISIVQGSGRVGPMGQVAVRGTIQSTSIAGQAIGTLTLQNRFGRVDIRITGQSGPSPESSRARPQPFDFVVTRATGRYASLADTGGNLGLQLGKLQAGTRSFRMELNEFVILSR